MPILEEAITATIGGACAAAPQTVNVQYTVANGSASAGSDFQAAAGTVVFAGYGSSYAGFETADPRLVALAEGMRLGDADPVVGDAELPAGVLCRLLRGGLARRVLHLAPADALVERMLGAILADRGFGAGARV